MNVRCLEIHSQYSISSVYINSQDLILSVYNRMQISDIKCLEIHSQYRVSSVYKFPLDIWY